MTKMRRMDMLLPTSVLMALEGFVIGWNIAPVVFAWFVDAFDRFFIMSNSESWTPIYLRFAFGVAVLFATPPWTDRAAGHNPPRALTILIYLAIGITGSVLFAAYRHLQIEEFRRFVTFHAFIFPPSTKDLPCLSIPLCGLATILFAAIVYRCRRWLHRVFADIFLRNRNMARYNY